MEERVLAKGKFAKFNIFSVLFIATAIFCFINLVNDYSGRIFTITHNYGYGYVLSEEISVSFIEYFVNGWVFRYALGWFIVLCSAIVLAVLCYFLFNRCEITVTDKRVFGKMLFGLRVDLPFDKISSISGGFLKSLIVATSSSKIIFWLMSNRDEVYAVINDVLIQRQNRTDSITPTAEVNDADELRKYRQLFEEGTITQEEFEAKKKQILGL